MKRSLRRIVATILASVSFAFAGEAHLVLDLDAAKGVETDAKGKVLSWTNQVAGSPVTKFIPTDAGRKEPGSGIPSMVKGDEAQPYPAVEFHHQELINGDEDAFDSLTKGSGHTWYAVIAVDKQASARKDTHAIFGNLRNTDALGGGTGGHFEGFWGVVRDDRSVYAGVRNGLEFKRDSPNNPEVASKTKLDVGRFYVIAGRMGAGVGTVSVEIWVNMPKPEAASTVVVNPAANPSKMAVGQERDATNHPGVESFDGKLARLLIYDTAQSNEEMKVIFQKLVPQYRIDIPWD